MITGLLILGLVGGVAAGVAGAIMGLSWWAAALVVVVAGNLVVSGLAILRVALASRGDRARDAGQPGPAGRDVVGQAPRALSGLTLR